MILKIKNRDRFVGTEFWNGCFLCTKADETDINYRFHLIFLYSFTDIFLKG